MFSGPLIKPTLTIRRIWLFFLPNQTGLFFLFFFFLLLALLAQQATPGCHRNAEYCVGTERKDCWRVSFPLFSLCCLSAPSAASVSRFFSLSLSTHSVTLHYSALQFMAHPCGTVGFGFCALNDGEANSKAGTSEVWVQGINGASDVSLLWVLWGL